MLPERQVDFQVVMRSDRRRRNRMDGSPRWGALKSSACSRPGRGREALGGGRHSGSQSWKARGLVRSTTALRGRRGHEINSTVRGGNVEIGQQPHGVSRGGSLASLAPRLFQTAPHGSFLPAHLVPSQRLAPASSVRVVDFSWSIRFREGAWRRPGYSVLNGSDQLSPRRLGTAPPARPACPLLPRITVHATKLVRFPYLIDVTVVITSKRPFLSFRPVTTPGPTWRCLWLHQRDAGFIDLGSHLIQFPSNQGIWSKSAIVCISRLLFQRS